jgi:hypothetical protein
MLFDIVVGKRRDARAAVLCHGLRAMLCGPVVSRVSDFMLLAFLVPALEVSGVWARCGDSVKKRVK